MDSSAAPRRRPPQEVRRLIMKLKLLAAAIALGLPTSAMAQAGTITPQPLRQAEKIPVSEWSYDDLYAQGWRSDQIWNAEVHGPGGEEIGDIENIIIGKDGRILSVIAEVGGLWDIGDTHISVPWNQVKVGTGFDRVTIPVTEENISNYSLFKDNYLTAMDAKGDRQAVDDDLTTGPRAWKLTDLTNDYVLLQDRTGYGWVDDVIFSRDGEIKAVVVRPDVGYGTPGTYAYPFYGWGYGWNPGRDYYGLPYDRNEITGLDQFDYERLETEARS
jgi:sporulation protein YlmC with PRC-barrel domain